MHEILRCSTCRAIVPVGEEHFYDAGGDWPCPTCGAIIRRCFSVMELQSRKYPATATSLKLDLMVCYQGLLRGPVLGKIKFAGI